MKADPDQIYHHEGQRGEPPQKQAIHNQQELAFSRSTSTEPRRSIYSVKTWDYTAPTSWTEGSLLFTNKEDRPATKMDYRLTAEVTESTPCGTPRDFCHSRRPSHRYTCCYMRERLSTGPHQPSGDRSETHNQVDPYAKGRRRKSHEDWSICLISS